MHLTQEYYDQLEQKAKIMQIKELKINMQYNIIPKHLGQESILIQSHKNGIYLSIKGSQIKLSKQY
jgi:hypothetical protein